MAIDTVFCQEVSSSAEMSPLAAAALITAASMRASLWPERMNGTERGLAVVAATAPKKGGEAYELIKEYLRYHAEQKDSVVPMILRDFYASIYAWQFIRSTDGHILDLCGSALCLTTAIDYVGAVDAPDDGGYDAYIAAASEGIACLTGEAATQALRDMVTADAFMVAKDAMAAKCGEIIDTEKFIRVGGGRVTPNEFLLARWWDAAMVPYHRLIMSTIHYNHLTDDLGTFKSADKCGKIKRAVDSIIRYDEIVDAISDYINKECFNEFLVALSVGGSKAIHGYANAVGRVTDDALECDCDASGHEEAAELAMGACLWYLLAPRYMARRQLHSYTGAEDMVRNAYAWPAPGARLRTIADTCLQPGNTLHATDWQPLWGVTGSSAGNTGQPPSVHRLARRIIRRSFIKDVGQEALHRSDTAARSVLEDCETLDAHSDLSLLSEKWCHLFETVVAGSPAGGDVPYPTTRELRTLVGRIWRHTVVGPDHGSTEAAEVTDERLFIDVDRAVRQTYLLRPAQGIAVRRAFFGVTTSAVELSGLGPYARLGDGAAHMHSLADVTLQS
ncbi:hypothetical protein ABZZ74_46795 [Streptomyces sp. NPDC006476]|uniref:hypothetical protein n=1 Tax=Streptomyces sp. NPDC006476 TaxID=3157175 RepID=UPI0033AE83BE